MNKRFPTPTRDGDWHVIDGQLVDMRTQPQRDPTPAPINGHDRHTPNPPPLRARRHRKQR